jgi:hypothetical protein
MLFADWFSDFLGQSCCMGFVVLWLIGWGISNLLKSDTVKEAAKIGFWAWFLSADD